MAEKTGEGADQQDEGAARQLAPDIGSSRTPAQPTRRKMIDGGFAVVIAMALVSGVLVWIWRGPERFFEILGEDVGLIFSIAPKVIAAVLLAAWMRRLIPKEAIAKFFGGESGFLGLTLAVVAGVILPGGPMTAFPIAVAFGVAGADAGAAAAFLSSWLLLSANRTIVWEMAFIDHEVVGWRVLLSLPIPFLLGYIARLANWPALPTEGETARRPRS